MPAPILPATEPRRILHGFGRSVQAACRFTAPQTIAQLEDTLLLCRREGLSVAFRGAGRSYGDAALNGRGMVVDTTRLNRVIRWEPTTGILEAEAGLTVEALWRATIEDGYWPAVVPGTMRPTLGGCVAMNVHGKNQYRAGSFGEHVVSLELLTPLGERLQCSPSQNAEVFRAVVGGMGLLGAITRVSVKLHPVHSGLLRVVPLVARNLFEMFDLFEEHIPRTDYLVGWVDGFADGEEVGRGIIHAATSLSSEEDPKARQTLRCQAQGLPSTVAGVPKGVLWRFMRPFTNDVGAELVNAVKFHGSRLSHGHHRLQSYAAFSFLLDYVPNWRLAYGQGGLLQHQLFVPAGAARTCMPEALRLCKQARIRPYLGVLKRHRSDHFLLSHALDGWSLALDFRVTEGTHARLRELLRALTECVLSAGGKFYFAKDSVLGPAEVERAYGRDQIRAFVALKRRLDPAFMMSNDLWERTLRPLADSL